MDKATADLTAIIRSGHEAQKRIDAAIVQLQRALLALLTSESLPSFAEREELAAAIRRDMAGGGHA